MSPSVVQHCPLASLRVCACVSRSVVFLVRGGGSSSRRCHVATKCRVASAFRTVRAGEPVCQRRAGESVLSALRVARPDCGAWQGGQARRPLGQCAAASGELQGVWHYFATRVTLAAKDNKCASSVLCRWRLLLRGPLLAFLLTRASLECGCVVRMSAEYFYAIGPPTLRTYPPPKPFL